MYVCMYIVHGRDESNALSLCGICRPFYRQQQGKVACFVFGIYLLSTPIRACARDSGKEAPDSGRPRTTLTGMLCAIKQRQSFSFQYKNCFYSFIGNLVVCTFIVVASIWINALFFVVIRLSQSCFLLFSQKDKSGYIKKIVKSCYLRNSSKNSLGQIITAISGSCW